MNIQVNTDNNIPGDERLVAHVNTTISSELQRFRNQITRVEVHLSDENGSKTGQIDKRCMLEARLENRKPIAVTSQANTVEKALSASLNKLKVSMQTINGQMKNR